MLCRVRAGVRNVEKAEGYLKTALEYGIIPADAAKRLTVVPVDLTDVDTLTGAIGNAGKVGTCWEVGLSAALAARSPSCRSLEAPGQ